VLGRRHDGRHGLGSFQPPLLHTQKYELYAYDYESDTDPGRDLHQSIFSTFAAPVGSSTGMSQLYDTFTLADPTGADEGIGPFPKSTDLAGWNKYLRTWDATDPRWTETFGAGTGMPLLIQGGNVQDEFTTSDIDVTSTGSSNSFGVSAGGSLDIQGFLEEGITVGYQAEWSQESSTTSSITTDVTCSMDIPLTGGTKLAVQPYWLQAKTEKAPWIPSSYNGNLPWSITWAVQQYRQKGAERRQKPLRRPRRRAA
jgi:hypothetical protein